MSCRASFALLALALPLWAPARAAAGNGDAVPVSNEAALMGQAAVANGTGAAAMYYNPALLGRLEQARADVTGSAFHLRISRSANLLTTPLSTTAVRNTEIVSIPSALAYARPIGDDWRVGFGVFSPTAQDYRLSVETNRVEGMRDGALRITLLNETSVYVGVLSVARRLAPGLWLGGSLEGVYATAQTYTFLNGRIADPLGSVVVSTEEEVELTFGGTAAQVGLTWDATPRATLALTISTPIISLSASGRVRGIATTGGGGELGGDTSSFETYDERLPPSRGPVDGVRFRAGAEVRATPRLRFAVDGEVWTPMSNDDLGTDVDAFWNLRFGLEGQVADTFWLAGGVFTDRQGERQGVNAFAASQVDFWGLTAGARWQSSYALAEGQERERVTFGSVIALRYAYGNGTVGGVRANFQAASEEDGLTFRVAELIQHELGIHIGAWTAF